MSEMDIRQLKGTLIARARERITLLPNGPDKARRYAQLMRRINALDSGSTTIGYSRSRHYRVSVAKWFFRNVPPMLFNPPDSPWRETFAEALSKVDGYRVVSNGVEMDGLVKAAAQLLRGWAPDNGCNRQVTLPFTKRHKKSLMGAKLWT